VKKVRKKLRLAVSRAVKIHRSELHLSKTLANIDGNISQR